MRGTLTKLFQVLFLKKRWLFSFLILLALFQMLWWGYLLIEQKAIIGMFLPVDSQQYKSIERFHWMIALEGTFFVLVWLIPGAIAYKYSLEQIKLQKSQNDFLSAVTHELKTPLATIQLSLESLQVHPNDIQKNLRFIERGLRAVKRLNFQIESVLQMSAVEPQQALACRFSLREAVNCAIEKFDSPEISQMIKVSGEAKVFAIRSDTEVILFSLIENAINYSPDGEQDIGILIASEGGRAFVKIKDNGIGISKSEASEMFKPFFRSERARLNRPSGSGLGLTLSRRLAERMKAKILFKSEGTDKGTEVTLSFKDLH